MKLRDPVGSGNKKILVGRFNFRKSLNEVLVNDEYPLNTYMKLSVYGIENRFKFIFLLFSKKPNTISAGST